MRDYLHYLYFPKMNCQDLLVNIYGRMYNRRHLHGGMLSPMRYCTRKIANNVLQTYLLKSHKYSSHIVEGLIVSFTSFPARIENVWQVVECMFRQTYLPEKIILWLSKEQFPSKESIPESLKKREGERFEIRIVDGDIRSHKKYYYVSREYPNKYVFLIDDDIYYPTSLLENSWKAHLKHPSCVICNYGFEILYDDNNGLKPYNEWKRLYKGSESSHLFFGSGGGTLFCPATMYSDLTNVDLAMTLTPLADDVWLNAMVKLANIPVILLPNRFILPIIVKHDKKLAEQNRQCNKNDEQIVKVMDYYKRHNKKVF